MLRRVELEGMSCLDMGTMEGLIPVLMSRGDADHIVAVDIIDHCVAKMDLLKTCYGVDFQYKSVGLMYRLQEKLRGGSFDLINCSGLLYHVYSPMLVLAGVRGATSAQRNDDRFDQRDPGERVIHDLQRPGCAAV